MGASIVSNVVNAFTSFITGIAGGFVDAFNRIALTDQGVLSDFAVWALVFAGVGIATTVIWAVVRKVG